MPIAKTIILSSISIHKWKYYKVKKAHLKNGKLLLTELIKESKMDPVNKKSTLSIPIIFIRKTSKKINLAFKKDLLKLMLSLT